MAGVRELLVKFGGRVDSSLSSSADKAGKEIDKVGDAAEKSSRRSKGAFGLVGAGAKAMAGPVAAAAATVASVDFFKGALEEAEEARKVGATTAQIIKQTGGAAKISAEGVGALAEAISNKTGIVDEQVQAGANMLLTFKNVRNEAGKGADIFNRATMAAQDLAAAGFGDAEGQAKMLGKALNDPIKGLSALGRSGVTFTEAQKAQIKAMVKSGDLLGAQKIMMAEVESQVGGVAEKTATAGQKMQVMWGNTKEQLGTMLLPMMDAFAGMMTSKVLPGLQGFLDMVDRNMPALRTAMAPFTDALGQLPGKLDSARQLAAPFFLGLTDLARGLAAGFRTHILPAISELVARFSTFAATVRPIVAEIVLWVQQQFARWAPTIKGYMTQITQIVGDVMRIIGQSVSIAMRIIGQSVSIATTAIRWVWDRWGAGILRTASSVFGAVVKAVGGALNVLQGTVRFVLSILKGDWGGAWNAIKQITSGALTIVKSILTGGWAIIRGIFTAGVNLVVGVVESMRSRLVQKMQGVQDGMNAKAREAKDWVLGRFRELKTGAEGVFKGIAETVAKPFGAIKGAIAKPLRDATGWLNKNVLSPMNGVTSKFGVKIPQLPKFHTGGIVPGRRELPALLLGGEGVLSRRGMDAIGGEKTLDALNRGHVGGVGGPGWDWIKKPAKWAMDAGKNGVAWALGKLFDAGKGIGEQFPPPMAGQVLEGSLSMMRAAVDRWAKGKDAAEKAAVGSAPTLKNGRRWPANTRALSGNYPGHTGVDIAAAAGSPIFAADAGRITHAGYGRGYGNAIFQALASGGQAVYGHGSKVLVSAGQQVVAGQHIGVVGSTGRSTGPHLHFEVNGAGALGSTAANRGYTLRWLGYDSGGWLPPGVTPTVNNTGKPEAVLTGDQWERLLGALEGVAEGGRSVVVDGRSLRAAIREEVRAAVATVRADRGVLV